MARAGRKIRRAIVAGALLAALAGWWWTRAQTRSAAWPPAAVSGGNLLLVTIDTLRADRLSSDLMPHLFRLGASGRSFVNAYAHAPMTLPSHASILTGLIPPAHGVRGNGAFRLAADQVTLAERLHARGYRTGAFVAAFVLDSRFGLDQGFDRYDGVDDDRAFAADFGFTERRAPEVLAAASRWILDEAGAGRSWFAWVHLFDPHAPYDAPGASRGSYDDEVRFVDAAIGSFLDRLRGAGALTSTAIVVTADHGESLGEHGEATHGLFAYNSTMRVPLIVAGPGLGAGTEAAPVAHIDIVPTVIDMLGLPADPSLPGRSLREPAPDRSVYLEAFDGWLTAGAAPVTSLVQREWKLIDSPLAELYDLSEDPGELTNRLETEPERARDLHDRLAPLAATPPAASASSLDADAQARLRSLGYAAGAARAVPDTFTAADDVKRIAPLYGRFLSLLEAGGRDIEGLLAVVEARPAFEAARLAAASILIENGRGGDAIALLEPVAGTPGASLALRERLGAAYLADGAAARAASILEPATREAGASADAWNALGVARAQVGRADDARAAFAEAARLAPGSARIRLNGVIARLEAGDRKGALDGLARLTADHPAALDAWRLLATLRHEDGDRAGAVAAWERVVTADAADFDSLFNLAVTLRDLGRAAEARDAAARFVANAPRPRYAREAALLAPLAR